MNVSIVFYSRSGTTEGLAGRVAKDVGQLGHDVTMVPIKHKKKPGFFGAARAAMKTKDMEIVNEPGDFDLAAAEMVILGGPIFAGNINPFMKTFLDRAQGLEGKPAGVFICCNSAVDEAGEYMVQMRKLAEGYGLQVRGELIGSRKVKADYDKLAQHFVLDLFDAAPSEIGGEGDETSDEGGDDGDGE
jgi:multimeric flavodoxin WrbA